MFKLSVTLTLLFVSSMLISYTVADERELLSGEDLSDLSPDEYEMILKRAVKRGLLARMLLEEPASEGRIEKRYPRWRIGSTIDRVNAINLNRNRLNPSDSWANNLREKSRLYERIHG